MEFLRLRIKLQRQRIEFSDCEFGLASTKSVHLANFETNGRP